jgi:hypothetical protein
MHGMIDTHSVKCVDLGHGIQLNWMDEWMDGGDAERERERKWNGMEQ